VQTAGNGGSELLIFVPRAAHGHDLLRATSDDSRLRIPGAAALRHLVELTESPDECETFTQEFRLAFGAVAEYGHC
jgi:hypothetical protein